MCALILAGCGRIDFTPLPDVPTCAALLCEDFETGVLDTSIWKVQDNLGSLFVDSTQPHLGSWSAHAHTEAAPSGSEILADLYEPSVLLGVDPFHVRVWFYASDWPALGMGKDTLVKLGNPGGNHLQLETGEQTRGVLDFGSPGFRRISTTTLPVGGWFCLEWALVPTMPQRALMEVAVDDVPVPELSTIEVATYPPNELKFGIDQTPTGDTGAVDLWIDDIVIDTVPIGCAR